MSRYKLKITNMRQVKVEISHRELVIYDICL